MSEQQQYIRRCNLVVSGEAGDGLDLSELRVTFAIKKTDGETPNTANIRVYGLNRDTSTRIENEFTRIMLQGGYDSNYGVIFDGNIKRLNRGSDNNVDHYLEVQAADGDAAYNFATVNATISAGATQRDQIEVAAKVMRAKGVEPGYIDVPNNAKLPRGKVMYGMSRDYIRRSAASSGASWTIQNGVLQVMPLTGVLPGQAVVLNSKTGLIGRAKQTNSGVEFRCLLNPMLTIGAAVQIDEQDVAEAQQESDEKELAVIAADGFYRTIAMDYVGDNRGNDWYCEGTALSIDTTMAKNSSVQGQ